MAPVIVALACTVSPVPADAEVALSCEGTKQGELAEIADVASVPILHGCSAFLDQRPELLS